MTEGHNQTTAYGDYLKLLNCKTHFYEETLVNLREGVAHLFLQPIFPWNGKTCLISWVHRHEKYASHHSHRHSWVFSTAFCQR